MATVKAHQQKQPRSSGLLRIDTNQEQRAQENALIT